MTEATATPFYARSMTFQINDASTGGTNPAVFITITENADGTLSFNVTQAGGIIGDLRGLFFDVNAIGGGDGALASSLSISDASAPSTLSTGDDSVNNLGNGSNMNGLTSSNGDGGFDAGINIGSAGIGSDDIRSFSFTMGSSARHLTLDDFANVDFGVRLTSVGTLGGTRDDSSKLLETTSAAIDAKNDTGDVCENETAASGNLLTNDANTLAVTTVTASSHGTLGTAVLLDNAEGATLTVNADGTWVLNAMDADALSEGEVLTYTFSYSAQSTSADQTSSDTAGFTVTVCGVNDRPDAVADVNGTDTVSEAGCDFAGDSSATGNVLTNDTDVDRIDSKTVVTTLDSAGNETGINTIIGTYGTVVILADGTWTYTLDNSNPATNALAQDDIVTDVFNYTMRDTVGATSSSTLTIRITGTNDVCDDGDGDTPTPRDDFPTRIQDISNVTLVFGQTAGDTNGDGYYTVKIDTNGLIPKDLDSSIDAILAALDFANGTIPTSNLLGVVIKGGNQEATQFYNYGTYNTDGTASDLLPNGIAFALPVDDTNTQQNEASGNVDSTDAIDAGYEITLIGQTTGEVTLGAA